MSKKSLAHKETLFEVNAPDLAAKAKPGQFVIVVPNEKGERIPLTICGYDAKKGTISFAFHEVGKTTKAMGCLNEGDCLMNVTGPLGNPSEIEKFGKVLCIGGSIMIAPALLQIKAMRDAGNHVTTVLGCRSKDFLFMENEAKALSDELYVASDDGTIGYKGLDFLKDLLNTEKFDRCIVLGPVVMMRNVSEITKPHGIPTIVTVTPIMMDGMGMCGVCRVMVAGEMKFGCIDGPEFDGHQLNFDQLVQRQRFMLPEERLSSMLWEIHGKDGGCNCGRNKA